MAENEDNKPKPKAELIKRTEKQKDAEKEAEQAFRPAANVPEAAPKSKSGDKKAPAQAAGGSTENAGDTRPKKVVIKRKKKPGQTAGNDSTGRHHGGQQPRQDGAPTPAPRQPESRVPAVPAAGSGGEAAAQAAGGEPSPGGFKQEQPEVTAAAPHDGGHTGHKHEAQKKNPQARGGKTQNGRGQATEVGAGQTGEKPVASPVQVFTASYPQRPAVQAGRVGGKYIGPRVQRQEGGGYHKYQHQQQQGGASSSPFTGRHGNYSRNPAVPRPGGTGGGFVPRQQGGFNQRPGVRPHGQTGFNNANRPMPPPPTDAAGRTPPKRNFKVKKPVYKHRDKESEMEEKLRQSKKKSQHIANPIPKTIEIMEVISVSELARKMNLKVSDLIQKLMTMGMMVTINQKIDSETAAILAGEYDCDVKIVSLYDQTVIETEHDDENAMMPRPPVVTVMGHVDHGKTKLLDAIRSSDVVSGEFGGITQHIGAYMVETPEGNITFLDTPGHEAFTRMRARGAQVTDIVVLVVAADDGVMPQTIEAINHAKEAAVPIVVAVNKIDKPEANPDKVKSQLAELGLNPEEWGGQTMYVHISAKKKEGIDKLIETVLLQAEILDLKANYNRSAEGKIIESKIDQGRGIVATVMVQKGTLEVGDAFVAGIWPGKVRAIFNDKGKKISTAAPAMPVEVLGFEGIPNAGDPIQVVADEKVARAYAAKRQELKKFEDAKNVKKITLDNLYDTISGGSIAELKVIIKGDVQGSVEALRSSLEKLSTKEVRLNVIQALPGAINEGDVDLAIASNAILIGFNVRPTPKARSLADQEKVDIRRYNIIYRVVEEMQQAMEGLLKPDTKEEVIANVEVRNVFKISRSGVVAGCYVQTGTVKRQASVNVIRSDTVIYTGKIAGLRRFKDDVKEVASGYECGISIDGFEDVQVGDELEVFEIVEIARKLS
ncbi:MAG: translation initiation factor IF-2 [Spirochaetaceae bacterium]|jgi:translation initiation factor IF-2|nr:translation initiation factor IF-2 [Spirochaetaceae bacterium]